jgi:hypothetical protein
MPQGDSHRQQQFDEKGKEEVRPQGKVFAQCFPSHAFLEIKTLHFIPSNYNFYFPFGRDIIFCDKEQRHNVMCCAMPFFIMV